MRLIPLTLGQFAKVDDEDYDRVSLHKWGARAAGCRNPDRFYALRNVLQPNGRLKTIRMHRFVLGYDGIIDHRDGDGLNNQKQNLRPATHKENCANRIKVSGGSSKWKGVSLKRSGKWRAVIVKDGRFISLGTFREECDAALAYNLAAVEFFGEFARFNVPLDGSEVLAK